MPNIEYYRMGDPRKPSVKQAVAAKMKVLREFYIVDAENAKEIQLQLYAEVNANPGRDYELVLDSAAKKLIEKKLNT